MPGRSSFTDIHSSLHRKTVTKLAAQALLDLGSLHFIAGHLDLARTHFDRALALGKRHANRRTTARALNQLGEIERFSDNGPAAVQQYEASLAIWHELEERERIAMVLHNLAPVVARLGDRQRAIEQLRTSLGISWELRNAHGLALCLVGIAGLRWKERSNASIAAALLAKADALRESIGVQWQPVDRAEFERSEQQVRKALNDEEFSESWRAGSGLDTGRAVELAHELLGGMPSQRGSAARRAHVEVIRGGLSRREYEVAIHVARGITNREIADHLHISVKTVEMHVSNALRKLGFRSRVQLATWQADHQRATQSTYRDCSQKTQGRIPGTSPIF